MDFRFSDFRLSLFWTPFLLSLCFSSVDILLFAVSFDCVPLLIASLSASSLRRLTSLPVADLLVLTSALINAFSPASNLNFNSPRLMFLNGSSPACSSPGRLAACSAFSFIDSVFSPLTLLVSVITVPSSVVRVSFVASAFGTLRATLRLPYWISSWRKK